MATTMADKKRWKSEARRSKATHIIVVCDTFDYEDYPVYVKKGQDPKLVAAEYNGKSMQRVMEIIKIPRIRKKSKPKPADVWKFDLLKEIKKKRN